MSLLASLLRAQVQKGFEVVVVVAIGPGDKRLLELPIGPIELQLQFESGPLLAGLLPVGQGWRQFNLGRVKQVNPAKKIGNFFPLPRRDPA